VKAVGKSLDFIGSFGALLLLVLLSSCAPATTGLKPATTLKQQLSSLEQQQQQQARQLEQLQQQLAQLQQQWAVKQPAAEGQTELPAPAIEQPEPTEKIPTAVPGAEQAAEVAASATSYLAAFADLAAGRWQAAELGFAGFISEFAEHQYAPNARYWMAQAQIEQGKFKSALEQLRWLAREPQARAKAPAALLQMAKIYRRHGETAQADNILEQLRNRFPESPEAQQIDRSSDPDSGAAGLLPRGN
jgi:tol-pal system protein YbgF